MDLLRVLDLEPSATGFVGRNLINGAGSVVFGGQMLAQAVIAATRTVPEMEVLSVQCSFVRSARPEQQLDIAVEPISHGRSIAALGITIGQDGTTCARLTVLLHVPDADLIRHQAGSPRMIDAETMPPRGHVDWWDVRYDPSIDIRDPEGVGAPVFEVWSRFPGASADSATSQALLAYASDLYPIATALRPHAGVGQALAHVAFSTTVLTQSVTFHEPFDASDWLLLAHHSPYAGRGRSYGTANVFAADGRMVASYAQANLVRAFAADRQLAERERSDH